MERFKFTAVATVASAIFLLLGTLSSSKASPLAQLPQGSYSRVEDDELEEMRGRFRGFYLEVIFRAFWQKWQQPRTWGPTVTVAEDDEGGAEPGDQQVQVNVSQGAGAVGFTASASDGESGGEDVKVSAVLGHMGGARGIFQINQVPGSMNTVRNQIILNITIISGQKVRQINLTPEVF